MNKDHKAVLSARGERLKRLRALAGMTSEELATQAGVSRASLSYWENANYNGLSHKGAESVVGVLKKRGLNCSVEWLLLGLGAEPSFGGQPISGMHQEMALFASLHPKSVIIQVLHHECEPLFLCGDYVGGLWESPKNIQEGYYIIQTAEGKSEVRKLKPGANVDKLAKIIRVWRPS